jgi:hypothetical protein
MQSVKQISPSCIGITLLYIPSHHRKMVLPFQIIAIDFIGKLPDSEGYDSFMTITDHDCTKAVILVLCQEKIDAKGVVKLFKDHAFSFIGLPKKIISDRDPRFMSTFFKELCHRTSVLPIIHK